MPAAPLDPTTGPDGAPASVGLRTWLTIGAGLLLFVLVPFALLGTWFESVATEAVYTSSPQWLLAAAIVGLLALDIVLPVPSSVVSTAGGAALGFWPGLAASTLGMTVLLAGIARLGGARFTALTSLSNLGVSAAYALAGATASATGSMLPAIAGAIVLPALVMGGASLARRRSRGRCEPTQT